MKSFDEFLEKCFPESRRKAYYLMAIHEHLPRIAKPELRLMGWTKARELVKVARREGQRFDCAPWVHKASSMPREEFKQEVVRHLTGQETEPHNSISFRRQRLGHTARRIPRKELLLRSCAERWKLCEGGKRLPETGGGDQI